MLGLSQSRTHTLVMRLIPLLLPSTLWSWCLLSIPPAAGQITKSIGWGPGGIGKRSMDARSGSEFRIIGRPDFYGFFIQLLKQDQRLDRQIPMPSWNHKHLDGQDPMSSWSDEDQHLDGPNRVSSWNHEDRHLDGQDQMSSRNDESVESDITKIFLSNLSKR
ncbi:uncharacterized protein LOC106068213 [Biomphalaria glabrata]|uniref:Uncharacterized protein LOC106068213 n=1 Tax=Biomphalaria glabrata TaxID=6526 RepID=A0A9U8ED72_BIOGL|nr:uncharacterized protein LOC106068213 [Biomphalaria glabrata]KAI8737920.1 hypothetical protein BgiBS90_035921 [Biomphalaria glabrata]